MADHPTQILVLLRETCDPKPPVRLTADGYGVSDRGLRRITNPADLAALEMALQLAAGQKGKVTAVVIGASRLNDHLRLALAMGADRAIRVSDHALEGGDAVSEARVVARLLDILRPEFTFVGSRLLDRGDDPAPALAAANLSLPYVTSALSLKHIDSKVKILRKSDRGARQMVETRTPCMLLFEAACCEPRYPSQAAVMAALELPIETWGLPELGLPVAELGAAGALLSKERCSFPRSNPQRVVTPDANLPAFERILALLSGGIKPREGRVHAVSAEKTVDMLLDIFKTEGLLGGSTN
jgi:electron transfer flavoprotein beta subunit